MSKKIVKITKEGVRESISGNAQELPSSAEFQLDGASFVQDTLTVAQNATGTVTNESLVHAVAPCVVILPSNPTAGQKVTILNTGDIIGRPVGVSASHVFTGGNGGDLAIDVSGTSSTDAVRDFYFVSFGLSAWVTGDQGGAAGLTGSYTF